MHVIVVGGGVIGLCSAAAIREAGADVTLVERGECGQRASRGNAGWIVPALSGPLTAPGALWRALRRMSRRNSPVSVRPRLDPGFVRWAWNFRHSATPDRHRAGLRAMVALTGDAVERFNALRSAGVDFEIQPGGLMVVGLDRSALEECLSGLDELRSAGYDGQAEVLTGDVLRETEPALSDVVTAGVHLRSERSVDPEALTRSLRKHLLASGAQIREHTEVTGLCRPRGGRWRVRTLDDELRADRVLVAAGIWSKRLLYELGLELSLEGARGDSVTIPGDGAHPRRALEFAEDMVDCTPFAGALRLAGNYEVGNTDETVDRGRLDGFKRSASRYLRDWRPREVGLEWAGIRPVTPDDLPFIGQVPEHEGLYLATGHGMLGVTLGPATGAAIAPLIVEGRMSPVLGPFRVDRFPRRLVGNQEESKRWP